MISDEFKRSLHWSGHLAVKCKCGKMHFSISERRKHDYEEGELEGLLYNERQGLAESHDDDFIEATILSGCTLVEGCDCGKLESFENTVWENKDVIVDYLKRQNKTLNRRRKRESKIIEGLPDESE